MPGSGERPISPVNFKTRFVLKSALFCFSVGFAAFALALLPFPGECSVTSIRAGLLPEGARIVVDLEYAVDYSVTRSGKVLEVSVNTVGTENTTGKFPPNRSASSYRAYTSGESMTLEIILMSDKTSFRHYPLSRPDRIVIDLFMNGNIPIHALSDQVRSDKGPVSTEIIIEPYSEDTPYPEVAEPEARYWYSSIVDRLRSNRIILGILTLGVSVVLFAFLFSLFGNRRRR